MKLLVLWDRFFVKVVGPQEDEIYDHVLFIPYSKQLV